MPLLTLPEAARLAGRPESAIRRAIRSGALKHRRFGNAYAIQSKDLEIYLASTAVCQSADITASEAPQPQETADESEWGAA